MNYKLYNYCHLFSKTKDEFYQILNKNSVNGSRNL